MGSIAVAYLPAHLNVLGAIDVGGYASAWKCIPLLVVLLIWTRLLTWVDKDTQDAYLPRESLNMGFMGGLILALILFFFLPGGFFVSLAAFLFIFVAEVTTYLIMRKQKVGLGDLQKQFKAWISSFGRKTDVNKALSVGGLVTLIAKNGNALQPPEAEAPERAGYDAVQTLLTDPLKKGADYIQLSQAEGAAAIKYVVDGLAYDAPSMSKINATAAVGYLKSAAGLDVEEKRKPQMATVKASLDGKKRELRVLTRGSTAGESAAIDVDLKSRHNLTIDELGFSENQLKVVTDVVTGTQGLVLVATPKGQGLTTLLYALARKHDAFLTHIHTIERAPDIELEGITQNNLAADAAAGEEAKLAAWVLSQEPDVLFIPRVDEAKTAQELMKFAGRGKRVYAGIRAGNTFDALNAWRKLVGDETLATKNLELVIAGRLMRKLCMACKMEYSPDPDTLRKLNMSPDKVGTLFQARTTALRDPKGNEMVCEFCKDLHFKGRIGVFETFTIDDEVRQTVQGGGSINQLKMLFKKQKRKYLQEQAVAMAVAGETSLQEVARILKSEGGSSSGGSSSGGGGGRSPAPSAPRPPSRPRPSTA